MTLEIRDDTVQITDWKLELVEEIKNIRKAQEEQNKILRLLVYCLEK